jgi:hypothetical protein
MGLVKFGMAFRYESVKREPGVVCRRRPEGWNDDMAALGEALQCRPQSAARDPSLLGATG